MRTIVHISDLHFGKVDKKMVDPLFKNLDEINPDLIIISGDLTQRASAKEYKEVSEFLKKLKHPFFVIPGNHDIPLYNLFKRFVMPFKNYSKFVSKDLSPFYSDDEIAVVGINSVRRFCITSGKIGEKQLRKAEDILDTVGSNVVKIVVSHHPFDLPHSKNTHHKVTHKVVARGKISMKRLAEKKVDVFLSGHLHVSHIGDTTKRYKVENYSGLIVQAGTTISIRSRGEPVSFNVLKIDNSNIEIENYVGENKIPDYIRDKTYSYQRSNVGWKINNK